MPVSGGYDLYYWPSIQGRGEFVRLALEQAGVAYVDVARQPESEGGGVRALMQCLRQGAAPAPFAPPFLRHGELWIAQTAAILAYLGPRHDLVPADEQSRCAALQHQLTIMDLVAETHDTHHPIFVGLYYEDQQQEAARRAAHFVGERLPKFLSYFEHLIERNPASDRHLVGKHISYPDLSLFQVVAGLRYAFPKTMDRLAGSFPRIGRLVDVVQEQPRIAAYLSSPRRLPFNEQGIFRHYPELDRAPAS